MGCVRDEGPENFGMGQKIVMSQNNTLYALFLFKLEVFFICINFVPDIRLFVFLMFISYSNWRGPKVTDLRGE